MIAIIFTLQNLKKVVLKYYIIVLLSGQLRRFHILLMRVDDFISNPLRNSCVPT